MLTFFELGGNSIIAARLFVQIEKIFNKKIPLATLFKASTVKRLASILGEKEWPAPWSSLVAIQSNGDGSKPPFFLMHSHGGNVLEYYPLAHHLGNDQPVYALQARGLDGNIIEDLRIEEMTAHYLREIRTLQPKGPYYLGGFCFGGSLALEAAHQLRDQGEEVALLALIQTRTLDYYRYPPETTFAQRLYYRLADRINLEMSNFALLGPKAKSFYLLERANRLKDIMHVKIERLLEPLLTKLHISSTHLSLAYNLEALSLVHEYAIQNYVPRPYDGEVILFIASRQPRGRYVGPQLGWSDLLNGNTIVHEVPGYQQNILKEPNVMVLAEKLKAHLEETQAAESGGRDR